MAEPLSWPPRGAWPPWPMPPSQLWHFNLDDFETAMYREFRHCKLADEPGVNEPRHDDDNTIYTSDILAWCHSHGVTGIKVEFDHGIVRIMRG